MECAALMTSLSFMPTIIEHAAYIIGQTPSAAAQDAEIMAQAHIAAHRLYRHSVVTVGIDIYNIEAEALGCQLRFYEDESIPGILTHPMTLDSDFGQTMFSPNLGRIQLVLDAASMVKDAIGNEAQVNVGICGPFSIMMELLGFESAIHAFIDEDVRAQGLLAAVLDFQKEYSAAIIARGLGVTVFESWASPPLVTPDIYRHYALPYEQALFSHLSGLGLAARPLVIGGDTRPILGDIAESGTTLLVSDFNTPLPLYVKKARERGLTLRANIDPKQVRQGDFDAIELRIKEICAQREVYPNIIIGTGVVPYDTPAEYLLQVMGIISKYEQCIHKQRLS